MQFLSFLTFAGHALATTYVAARVDQSSLNGLLTRQFRLCNSVPVGPNLCERSCGPGYITCISEPTCYNPSRGDVCCTDGTYCEAGSYCTDIGCCEDSLSLEECGAHNRIGTVPPPAPTSSSTTQPGTPTSTTTSSTRTTSTSTSDSTSTSSSTSTPSSTPTSSSTATSTPTCPPTSSNPSPTATQPPRPTNTNTPPPVVGGSPGYASASSLLAIIGGLAILLGLN